MKNFLSLFILLSLIFLVFKGLNYGVDFKGGTLIEIRVESEKPDIEVLRSSFNKLDLGKISIKNFWMSELTTQTTLVCFKQRNILQMQQKN